MAEALLKIGEVARRAGVPIATAKFYVRAGLVPIAKKTKRNMAWYAADAIERIKLVKELQEKRFLPLKLIKSVIAHRTERGFATLRGTLSDAAERALAGPARSIERERAAEMAGLSMRELAGLEAAGVIGRPRAGEPYDADDARFLEIVGDLRRAGFTRRRGFSVEQLVMYKRAVDALASEEVALFLSRVIEKVPAADAGTMLGAALEQVGELIAVMRRKALAREVALLREVTDGASRSERPPRREER